MRKQLWVEIEEAFHRVSGLPEADREAFLRASPYDAKVKAEVAALLRFSERRHAVPRILDEFRWCEDEAPPSDDGAFDVPAGTTLGDFLVESRLGAGGMGVVYRARQLSLDRVVALKVLSQALLPSPTAVERFRREALATAKLRHANIVAVHAEGRANGSSFFAMELLEGENLARVIRRLREGESSFVFDSVEPSRIDSGRVSTTGATATRDPFEIVALRFAEVADALQYAHEHGVIHRDVKPSNLFLTREGRLKLVDFGIARMLEQPELTATGDFLGTPAYMSPEQLGSDNRSVDRRTDIYSFGISLYEFLTLQPAFSGDTREQLISRILTTEPRRPRRVNPQIPAGLELICLKAIEKHASDRYPSAESLAEDLRGFASRTGLTAKRVGVARRGVRWARRRPTFAALAICCAAVAILAVVYMHRAEIEGRERLAAERLHARDNALLAALGGNLESAEEWISRAEDLEIERGWTRMLRGQVAFQRRDIPEAVRLLTEAVDEMPERASPCAMLVRALVFAGQWKEAVEILGRLESLELVDPEDFLFVGLAQSMTDSTRGLNTLREGLRRRNSALGRLLLADAETNHALCTGEASDAISAVEDATVAQRTLESNLYAVAKRALAHLIAARALSRQGNDAESAVQLGHCERYVRALEPLRGPGDVNVTAWYLEWLGDRDAAMREWRRGFEAGNRNATWRYVAALYERDRSQEALDLCQAYSDLYPIDLARAYVLIDIDPRAARRAYDELVRNLSDSPDFYPTIAFPTIALLLRDSAEAVRMMRGVRDSIILQPGNERWARALLDFHCGLLSEEEFLEVPRACLEQTCESYFRIALTHIARRNPEIAMEYLRKAIATDFFDCFEYVWSRVFLTRMESDPEWPRLDG